MQPQAADSAHGLKLPDDLCHHNLLHDDGPEKDDSCPDWGMWLKEAEITCVDGALEPRFNQSRLLLEAAAAGQAVELAKSALAATDVTEGRWVRPFEASQPIDFGYYLVCTEAKSELPRVQAFTAWIKDMAAREQAG